MRKRKGGVIKTNHDRTKYKEEIVNAKKKFCAKCKFVFLIFPLWFNDLFFRTCMCISKHTDVFPPWTVHHWFKQISHFLFKTQIHFFCKTPIKFSKHKYRFQNFTILQSVYVQRRKHICISKRKQGFLKNLNPDFKTQIQVFETLLFYNQCKCKGGNTFVFKTQTRIFEEPKSRFQNTNTGFRNFTILQSVYVQR